MYMSERFGAFQVGTDEKKGPIEFKIFFPDRALDPGQYAASPKQGLAVPKYGDPEIDKIQVVGDFQLAALGQPNWDLATAPQMTRATHPKGFIYRYQIPVDVPAEFYQYKFYVTFKDGARRWVGDPCARYGGSENQNSGVVVGGSRSTVRPLAGGRKPLRDLVIYELMIDDFTDEFRGWRAPLDAVCDKLDYLANDLGVNAILFMPWTAWPGEDFSWGYTPYQYFSVEHRYANALRAPAEKLSWLKKLISECHDRGIHVIMDGVFNHVGDAPLAGETAYGFPYHWLYRNHAASPYTGAFGNSFPGLQELDFHNGCTREFIRDVCLYWIEEFKIDGIRFDNTVNFYIPGNADGLPQLLSDIQSHVAAKGEQNFSLTLEHIDMSAAEVVKNTAATSYWHNGLYEAASNGLPSRRVGPKLLNALDSHAYLPADRVATTYVSNHDHSHVAWWAGQANQAGGREWHWSQPYAMALLTAPGAPMIQNGQEFTQDYWILEDEQGGNRRVRPRPLWWSLVDEKYGKASLAAYKKLIAIRNAHPALRSSNFYPAGWEDWQTRVNEYGYGLDTERQLAIYHRWGVAADGDIERFIIVLNFSGSPQKTDIPFSVDGAWDELLEGGRVQVSGFWLRDQTINPHWGKIFCRKG